MGASRFSRHQCSTLCCDASSLARGITGCDFFGFGSSYRGGVLIPPNPVIVASRGITLPCTPAMTVDKPLKTDSLNTAWNGISAAMKAEVSTDTFNRWFKDIQLVELDAKKLTLRVPNNIYQLWIESNYLGMLRTAVLMELGAERDIRFALADTTNESTAPSVPAPVARQMAEDDLAPVASGRGGSSASAGGMNPRNTFECFVVGANNEYAHAACLAVSNSPGKTYNPLFIYGGVGLGKTHLMQAIGQAAIAKKRTSKSSI